MLRGLFIIILMGLFIGVCCWAWSRKRKQDFDAAAQLPLKDDDEKE